ncbi:GTP pyrophosphokinase [Ruegeria arenilitoris]|uniref:GTP pyrophosphokinase n=1 Tax=Ruegeria arenilitoris TaxID=1173585 RepID=UPI00147A2B55|nr:hypothetical protein [Ruegeria arenilitoris]
MKKDKLTNEQFATEYNSRLTKYKKLQSTLDHIIPIRLSENAITPLDCNSRLKTIDSAKKKFENKQYINPFQEMTDLVGYRIVVYLESDIELVDKIIRDFFEIDEQNSIDKLTPATPKEVGYRSLHLVCKLGSNREILKEYAGICDLPFEVQIRTTLQHTWAEIEHKQNYKSEQSLPPVLQRRLNIVAGTLELLDRELSDIARASGDYNALVQRGEQEIENDNLTASSIFAICEKFLDGTNLALTNRAEEDFDVLISELSAMGIDKVSDLKTALKKLDPQTYPSPDETVRLTGLLRTAMAAKDISEFYKKIGKTKNMRIPKSFLSYLEELKVSNVKEIERLQKG